MADGETTIKGMEDADSEGALEIIENIAGAGTHYHLAANLPNVGQIPNLPSARDRGNPCCRGRGGHPPGARRPVAGTDCRTLAPRNDRRPAERGRGLEGSREKALQCLLLDPIITDIEQAKLILDDYLVASKSTCISFGHEASADWRRLRVPA